MSQVPTKLTDGKTGFSLDISGMNLSDSDFAALDSKFATAHAEMKKIEAGEIKNQDEERQVTHFTDRIAYPGSAECKEVNDFAEALRSGTIKGVTGKKFEYAIINGIGGSALGPQLVQFAINSPYWNELSDEKRKGFLKIYFTDNTDTAGVADILAVVDLDQTLVVSISKSGGTQETKNNLTAFEAAFAQAGLDFAKHACAITMEESKLDTYAQAADWLRIFPMAESIGGRTSETSIVGHLPAALAGIDFKAMLAGSCHMDEWTRNCEVGNNPSYLLAATWYLAGGGKGDKNMIIVPYSDRLVLLSRYLQQLVMESIGKEFDRDGNVVHQGLNVFGNKGGTDAHAFIQQLNDGRNDFFISFIEVMKDPMDIPIEDGIYMGDYLHGFQGGLANALQNKGRQVIQMCIDEVNAFNLGMFIALYERAVAFYAELINVNAFHQPGVEAYKKASKAIIGLLQTVIEKLPALSGSEGTAAELAEKAGLTDQVEDFAGILAKFAENKRSENSVSRTWCNDKQQWIYKI